jgi:hypothetical protein
VESEPTTEPHSQTEQELERADKEDSGRGLEFFWLNVEGGIQHLGLQTLKANHLVDSEVVKTVQTGPLFGGGLGVRLVFLTLGARFRFANFPDYQVWTLDGEVGFRIPIGILEPYFMLGGGYASLGALSKGNFGTELNRAGVAASGFNLRGGGGLDIYLSKTFSIGACLTGEVLFLKRPKSDASALSGLPAPAQQVYALDGSSIGSSVNLTGVVGLHF